MTQLDLFQVGGTAFRFPPLPPEDWNIPVRNRMLAKREYVLTEARKVKREKTVWKAPRETHVKPGDGVFVPKEGSPGSTITLSDGRKAEVWSVAPAPRSVWALLSNGTCVEVSLRHNNSVMRTWKWESQVRTERIAHAANQDDRARHMAYSALDEVGLDWQEAQFARAKAWALAWISHELFPEHYPKPAPFQAEVPA